MISQEEILRRRDMRDVLTFTIDPADAKDFDDAISFLRQEDGDYQVGVHIADVTHYVLPGDDIDKEAYDKATSVYLVDKVLPMLPEELCNDLCSLRPHEEKLCMSVIFTLTADARVKKSKVCRTVICSDHRFSYEEAQAILTAPGDGSPMVEALKELNMMARVLRQRRITNGALEIEQDEVHFTLDENRHPVSIYFTEPTEANHLIEEFMLLANRTIAEQMGRTGKTMIYRIHDKPDTEKLSTLKRFRKRMGDRVPQRMYDLLTVRAMAKAVYSTQNIGHYGLAFDYYTHFTSPIRRYPDMMVHRLVAKYILGERTQPMTIDLQEAADHCSDMEQMATQAERDSVKEMQALWIHDHIGEVMSGYISTVTEFGLFVTLNDSHCDGLVPIRTLCPGEFLQYDEKNCCLSVSGTAKRRRRKNQDTLTDTKKCYRLGDEVQVRVIRADVEKRQIDFELIED